MFTQAICLTHYSEDFITRLELVGYRKSIFSFTGHATRDDFCILTAIARGREYIVVAKKAALSTDPQVSWTNRSANRYITDNETIAWGLACLRDGGDDKYQFFTVDCNVVDLEGNPSYEKGTLVFCTKDKWNVDVSDDGTPSLFSSRNIPAHKSTKEEIINYFAKENKL